MKRPKGEDLYYQYEGEVFAEHIETGERLICVEGDEKIGMRSMLQEDIPLIAGKIKLRPCDVKKLEEKIEAESSEQRCFVFQELEIREAGTNERMIIGIAELESELLKEKKFSGVFFVPKQLTEATRNLVEQTILPRILSVIQKYYRLTNLTAELEIKSISV